MAVTINASTSSGLVQAADTSGQIELQTNGTTVATVNTSNNVKFKSSISVGDATPTTSGAGITFPATQSASSDANTLDDYEEGTWSPQVRGSTTAGTTTYSVQNGWYTKIGNTVHVGGFVEWTNQTGTGNLQFGNLPFVANASYYSHLTFSLNNITLSAGNYPALLETILSSTTMNIYQAPTGGGGLNQIPVDTIGGVYFGGVYSI